MFKALIVDDEPAARRLLRQLLNGHLQQLTICGEAATAAEAIRLLEEQQPDLVFLDIQLPDQSGFDVIQQLSYQPEIIFTTAYEEYALRAFDSFSIDYLLKPLRQERVDAALQKFYAFGKRDRGLDLVKLREMIREVRGSSKPAAFPLRTGDRILLVKFEEISHFEADDKYVFLFTRDGRKLLTDQTLSTLEATLPDEFIRVQKSFVINKNLVLQIQKHFNGRFILHMDDGKQTRIRTGLTYYDQVRSCFGI